MTASAAFSRNPTEEVLTRLSGVIGNGPRWRARCPCCGGASRKLSVLESAGVVLIHCFAGCDVRSVVSAIGLELDALFPPRTAQREQQPPLRKPWRTSEIVSALRGELFVGAVLLMDIAASNPHSEQDRERAKEAVERIGNFLDELEHAC